MNPAPNVSSRSAIQYAQNPAVCALFPFRGVLTGEIWLQRLDQALARQGELSVFLLAFDGIEAMHDPAFGAALAQRLRPVFADTGTLGYLASGFFAVFASHHNSTLQPRELAACLLATINTPTLDHPARRQGMAVSIGVAEAPRHGNRSTLLLSRAELALRRARRCGGGMYLMYDSVPPQDGRRRQRLVGQLRQAVAQKDFRVTYQPVIGADGQLRGAEASLRWNRTDDRMPSPTETLVLLEETGLSAEMGHWLLQESCRQSALWRQRHAGFTLHVRLANVQLRIPTLVPQLRDLLDRARLPPQALHVEIVEGVRLTRDPVCRSALEALHGLGIGVWLGHDGSWDGAFDGLHRLPIQGVRVDRNFLRVGASQRAREDLRLNVATSLGRVPKGPACAPQTACPPRQLPHTLAAAPQAFLYGAATAATHFEHTFLR